MTTYHQSRNSQTSGEPEVVTFVRQRPYADFRPMDYRPSPLLFEETEKKMEQWLSALFAGEIDDGNGNVLDSLIIDTVRLAMDDLADQHVTHLDRIRDLHLQFQAGKVHFEEQCKDAESLLEELEAEHKEASDRAASRKWRKEA